MSRIAFILVGVCLVTPVRGAAQTATPPVRGYLSINGGMQAGSHDFQNDATFVAHAEEGRLSTDYTVKGGPALDIGGGAVVWRRLAVGVGVTRFSRSTPAALNASVPHPFFFGRNRAVSGEVGGLTREELAIHVRASGVVPVGTRMQVTVFGGPSFFKVKQGLVTGIGYAEEYPYDAARFTRGDVIDADGSKLGFNAGADIAFFFTRTLGIGGLVQFSGATVPLASAGGEQEVTAGGVQAGGGLRVRF